MRNPSLLACAAATYRLALAPQSGRLAGAWLFAVVLALSRRASQADLIVEADPITAPVGSAGAFDLLLVNTNTTGGASYSIGADTIQITLTGLGGVTITGATIETATPYTYQTSGTTVPGGGPFVVASTPTGLLASDAEFGPPGFDVILPGQSFGLAHVTYDVAIDAVAGQVGSLSLAGTTFSDAEANSIPVTLGGGTFTVAAVPGPSSFLLAMTGLTTWGAIRAARRGGRNPG